MMWSFAQPHAPPPACSVRIGRNVGYGIGDTCCGRSHWAREPATRRGGSDGVWQNHLQRAAGRLPVARCHRGCRRARDGADPDAEPALRQWTASGRFSDRHHDRRIDRPRRLGAHVRNCRKHGRGLRNRARDPSLCVGKRLSCRRSHRCGAI